MSTRLTNTIHLVVFGALVLQPTFAYAAPAGGVVSAGDASIASSGNTTTITQNSGRAILDWQSFDVGAGERVQFVQQDASSIALNRIHDIKASEIYGAIDANGQVWLINPHGVIFGAGADVNVGSLVATTSDISNDRFMNGDYRFDAPGDADGTILNAGRITAAEGGLAALVAPSVTNNGIITARLGKIHMASGDSFTLDLTGDGLISLAVSDAVRTQLVANTGTIEAQGGLIRLTASAGKDVVDSLINMDGVLDTSNHTAGAIGGTITVTGPNVTLAQHAVLNATGDSGGGTVLVGGDAHGAGTLANAQNVTMEHGARIDVSATTTGNGGKAVLWSDDTTDFAGSIFAKGGALSGNGGFVEASGKKHLWARGYVDTSAVNGNRGLVLFDPTNFRVLNRGATPGVDEATTAYFEGLNSDVLITATNDITFDLTGDSMTLGSGYHFSADAGNDILTASNGTIRTQGAGNILLTAGRDINITNDFGLVALGSGSVTERANNSVLYSGGGDITTNGGNITLNSDRDASGAGAIYVGGPSDFSSNGGDIKLGGGSGAITAGSGFAYGTLVNTTGVAVESNNMNTGGGNLIMNGHGYNASAADLIGVVIGGGGTTLQTGAGSMYITGVGGDGGWGGVGTYIGWMNLSATSGNIVINGTGGISPGGFGMRGVRINNGAAATSINTVSGNITITGTGGTSAAHNDGILVNNGSLTQTSGTGNIILNGIQAAGGGSDGLEDQGGTYRNTGTGNITINADLLAGTPTLESNNTVTFAPYSQAGTTGIAGATGDLQITSAVLGAITAGTLQLGRADGTGLMRVAGYDASARNWNLSLLNGSGNIQFDGVVGGSPANITLATNKNFSASSLAGTGSIVTNGVGGIVTSGTGTIDLWAGTDVDFTHDFDLTSATGAITLRANRDVIEQAGGDITTNGGAITLNSDRDANNDGAIHLSGSGGTVVASNGGNITLGGGANPATTAASNSGSMGINLEYAAIDSGTGNMSLIGRNGNGTQPAINLRGSTLAATGGGSISLTDANASYLNVNSQFGANSITTQNGNITLTGTTVIASAGGAGNDIYASGSGNIVFNGDVTITGNQYNNIVGNASSTGNITFYSNTIAFDHETITTSATGSVIFAPGNTANTVGFNGAVGTLQVTGAILDRISTGTVQIGRSNGTGLIRAAGYDASARNYNLLFLNGNGSIQFDGAVGGSPANITMAANKSFSAINDVSTMSTSANAGIITSGTGDISFEALTLTLGGNLTLTSADTITTNINIRGAYDMTATAGTIDTQGSIGSGIALNNLSLTAINSLTLGSITANTIFARTTGAGADITLNNNLTATANSGNSVILASADDFFNPSSRTLTTAGTARWLIYSEDPAQNTLGGLTSAFTRGSSTYVGYAPGSVVETGNGLLYSSVYAPPPANNNASNDALARLIAAGGSIYSGYRGSLQVNNPAAAASQNNSLVPFYGQPAVTAPPAPNWSINTESAGGPVLLNQPASGNSPDASLAPSNPLNDLTPSARPTRPRTRETAQQ